MDDARGILLALARTALLCMVLGGLLYAALTHLAEYAWAPQALGLVLAAPLAGQTCFAVLDALRSGVFPARFRAVRRDAEPVAFWISIVWFAGCALGLAVLAVWCAIVLLTS